MARRGKASKRCCQGFGCVPKKRARLISQSEGARRGSRRRASGLRRFRPACTHASKECYVSSLACCTVLPPLGLLDGARPPWWCCTQCRRHHAAPRPLPARTRVLPGYYQRAPAAGLRTHQCAAGRKRARSCRCACAARVPPLTEAKGCLPLAREVAGLGSYRGCPRWPRAGRACACRRIFWIARLRPPRYQVSAVD